MPLVYACITPHGGEILPELAGDRFEAFAPTRRAMEELGRNMAAHRPDVIIVVTPHGLRLEGFNSVVTAAYSSGSLTGPGGAKVEMTARCDRELAREIVARVRAAGIPAVGCNYGALEGPGSNVALDWGAMVPLYFFGYGPASTEPRPDVVLIGPTRDIPLAQLVEMGRVIANIAENSERRIAFVASADQAHAHSEKGPYGYNVAAAEYDRLIQEIVEEDRLQRLLDIDLAFVEEAKPDSLWQMVMLLGVTEVVPMKGRFLSYQVPTYFGMLCASYDRV